MCGVWHGAENGAQNYKPGDDWQPPSVQEIARMDAARKRADAELTRGHESAALLAQKMMREAVMMSHAYVSRKGFPALLTPCSADGRYCYVPAWKNGTIRNVQMIDADPLAGKGKRFLPGGEMSGCYLAIGTQGRRVYCEGYATGLSIAKSIKAMRLRAHVIVCFSANNLVAVSQALGDGVVVADNDNLKSGDGEKWAKKTGLAYWMPSTDGDDANDHARKFGVLDLSLNISKLLAIEC